MQQSASGRLCCCPPRPLWLWQAGLRRYSADGGLKDAKPAAVASAVSGQHLWPLDPGYQVNVLIELAGRGGNLAAACSCCSLPVGLGRQAWRWSWEEALVVLGLYNLLDGITSRVLQRTSARSSRSVAGGQAPRFRAAQAGRQPVLALGAHLLPPGAGRGWLPVLSDRGWPPPGWRQAIKDGASRRRGPCAVAQQHT